MGTSRLAREWRAFSERVLVPGLAACLPVQPGHSFLQSLARNHSLLKSGIDDAWNIFERYSDQLGVGEQAFKERHRLYWLIDFTDLFLLQSRSNQWLEKNVRLIGDPLPEDGPIMALTFHFGAGMWAMRVFGQTRLRMRWLHAPVEETFSKEHFVLSTLGKLRIREVEHATGYIPIPTGGSYGEMSRWIDQGGSITALIDAPHMGRRSTRKTKVLGLDFHLADGLARLASEKRVPVYLYSTTLAKDNFRRDLRLKGPIQPLNAQGIMDAVGSFMDNEIRRDPAAWHCWPYLDGFIRSLSV